MVVAGADDTDGSNDGDDGFIIVCSVIAICHTLARSTRKCFVVMAMEDCLSQMKISFILGGILVNVNGNLVENFIKIGEKRETI